MCDKLAIRFIEEAIEHTYYVDEMRQMLIEALSTLTKKAERWDGVRMVVGGKRELIGHHLSAPFFHLDRLTPREGANIMQGSVTQHFEEAIDDYIERGKK